MWHARGCVATHPSCAVSAAVAAALTGLLRGRAQRCSRKPLASACLCPRSTLCECCPCPHPRPTPPHTTHNYQTHAVRALTWGAFRGLHCAMPVLPVQRCGGTCCVRVQRVHLCAACVLNAATRYPMQVSRHTSVWDGDDQRHSHDSHPVSPVRCSGLPADHSSVAGVFVCSAGA